MDPLIAYLISVAAGITVAVLAKPGWLAITGLIQLVLADLPRVSGNWTSRYIEPTETGAMEEMHEDVTLHQLGRLVWGEGRIRDERDRVFKYRAVIVRQTLYGTYRRKRSKKPAGTGTLQLQITGSDKNMEGWCLWHDQDTDDIEASQYEWTKAVQQ